MTERFKYCSCSHDTEGDIMAGDGLIVGCFDGVTVSGLLTEVASILLRTGIIFYKRSCQSQHTKT